MAPSHRDQVFISYSQADRKWLQDPRKYLKRYEGDGSLTVWADEYIEVGDRWEREID